ncbi:MAG: YncE family protein [Candidatus Korobacteraceae bacterium]
MFGAYRQVRLAAITILIVLASLPAIAQTLITTVTAGSYPVAITFNPATNKIYVVNQNSNNVTVIDGVTYKTNTVATGATPNAIAVNSATNKIYVANGNSDSVTVINGANNSTASVSVGDYPIAVAANPVTNKIYVANYYANNVTVIDGTTNHTTTVSTGSRPIAVAINSATNKIYVADNGSEDLTIIDGATNSTTRVGVGSYPLAIAVDQYSNKIYVVNYTSNNVSIVDGETLSVTNVNVGSSPSALALNPMRDEIYVANKGDGTVTIVNTSTLATTTVAAGTSPEGIDVDPITNKAYVSDFIYDGSVTMIDGSNDSTSSVLVGNFPTAVAVNSPLRQVYVVNSGGNSVSVVAGAASDPLQFVPWPPCRVADTRQTDGPFGGPFISGGATRSFTVPQSNCNIPDTALAYSLNVTVVPLTKSLNFLTVWPAGEPLPNVSTLNSPDGRAKADATIVPAGADGAVSVYATDSINVILDINGYFQPASSQTLQFYSLAPCRVVDTRTGSKQPRGLGPPLLQAQQVRDLPILSSPCLQDVINPQAYSLNVTVVPNPSGQQLGFLTVWPSNQPLPIVSTLNNPTATVVANAAIVPAAPDGDIDVYAYNSTDLIIDINGYFAAASTGLSLYPSQPCRVIDTRSSGGAFDGQRNPPVNVTDGPCPIPSTAQEYVFNATVVPSGSLGYLTLWADGSPMPSVSTLNATDGKVASNMAIVGNVDGKVDAYAYGWTNLILDISSYFAP